jgi:2-polyprenyl-3-methyl-5-hydroxy-6-metoxy-1,4-benzoquinol methylase
VILSNNEIKRLSESFGWKDWDLDANGVRSQGQVNSEEISFPADSWDENSFNEMGMGVWSEMRLEHISNELKKNDVTSIWEIGAGNGAVALGLTDAGIGVVAVEPLYSGAKHLAKNGLVSFFSTLENLALPDKSLPAIGIFDVLEHIEDPQVLLTQFRKKLMGSGVLAITVPAHQWLFSSHDSDIGHFRRYSADALRSELESAGFEIVTIRYLFSFLVPLAWVLRVLPERIGLRMKNKSIERGRKQFGTADKFAAMFRFLSRAETKIGLPLGLSILCVAQPIEN